MPNYPSTPDGRYFVVRGRLWRKSNPRLTEQERSFWVKKLMVARSGIRRAKDDAATQSKARALVDEAKVALGERGPVWWDDGTPDYNRHLARNTPYAEWFDSLKAGGSGATG